MAYNDELLDIASQAGKIMLESGAEVSRVEQTVMRLCTALGAAECEAFATQTAIVMSVKDGEGRVDSIVRRITRRQTRLDKVEAVNSLSRRVEAQGTELAALRRELAEIAHLRSYTKGWRLLASGLGAGAFAVFFGGGAAAFLCSCAAGLVLRGVLWGLDTFKPNLFVSNLVGGAVAALCGLLCTVAGFTASWQQVTVAVLMLMVPGVAMTNALRDIAAGELLAGISRMAEAFCIAAALGCGTALVLALAQLGGVAV